MTPAEWAERTAQAQGFPARVSDEPTLARIASLLVVGAKGAEDGS